MRRLIFHGEVAYLCISLWIITPAMGNTPNGWGCLVIGD